MDWLIIVVGGLVAVREVLKARRTWDRIADMRAPVGILWWVLAGAFVGQRRRDRLADEDAAAAKKLGELAGGLVTQNAQRADDLLALQGTATKLNRWLLILTLLVVLLGVGSILATILTG